MSGAGVLVVVWLLTSLSDGTVMQSIGVPLTAHYTPVYQPKHVHIAYGGNTSEMVVTWSTVSRSGVSQVEWGTNVFHLTERSYGNSSIFVDGGQLKSTQWIHRVHLFNLKPNTTYFYHVGGSSGWSPVYGFKTVPSGTEGWKLRLALFGDLGVVNAQALTRLQQEAHQGMYDAVLHVGDMAYDMYDDNGTRGDSFMEQIEPIAAYLPYMTCPGNHEYEYDFLQYRARFSMPRYWDTESLYYSYNIGPVHFISISTEVYYFGPNKLKRMNRQYLWLLDDLKKATAPSARAVRPWIIVYGHRPMYCAARDDSDCNQPNCITRVGLPILKWFALEPLLIKYGVDLAVWAHEHLYQRLYPLCDFKVMNGTKEHPYMNPRGPVHIITGSAGCDEELTPPAQPLPDWCGAAVPHYGYTRMTVHNKTHLYWEQVAHDKDGEVLDRVWLVREEHGPYMECL